jgi:hypothetical protein
MRAALFIILVLLAGAFLWRGEDPIGLIDDYLHPWVNVQPKTAHDFPLLLHPGVTDPCLLTRRERVLTQTYLVLCQRKG